MRWWQWAIPLAIGAGAELYRQWRKAQLAPVVDVAADDPAMTEAIAQARATLPEFVRILQQPLAGHRDFSIKAFFPDLLEHMWIANVVWADGVFNGNLGNEPRSPSTMKIGDPVSIPEERVTDWKYIQHDLLVGGYSIRLLLSRMDDATRKALLAQADFRIV
jgi:uncharacterized protein YegJ (DUF2314 family)